METIKVNIRKLFELVRDQKISVEEAIEVIEYTPSQNPNYVPYSFPPYNPSPSLPGLFTYTGDPVQPFITY